MSWIAINERLPGEGGWFLVTREDGQVDTEYYFFGEGWKEDHNPKIIAWQPLPEPYTI